MVNWKAFLSEIEREPKNFAKAIVDYLNPPKYVLERIRKFMWICHFCWKPSIDMCVYCYKRVCEDHLLKVIGEKTKLEWYFCDDCQKSHTLTEIQGKVKDEDERFYLEDHPTP